MLKRGLSALVVVCCVGFATPSQAVVGIGGDIGAAIPLGSSGDTSVGLSLDLRVFNDWNVGIAKLGVEVSGGYAKLLGNDGSSVARVMLGGRAALGYAVEPYLFAHIGYASINDGENSLAFDAGLGVSMKVSMFRLGLQASYNLISGDTKVRWLTVALRVEVGL